MNQLLPVGIDPFHSRAASPSSVQKALLIVGVSRSGTSLLSHLVHCLGAAVPNSLMGAGHGNPMGHWEPQTLVALNDEILLSVGMTWSDPRPIPRGWFSSRAAYDFLVRIKTQIQLDYGAASLIVLKDPRLPRLMPLYLAALDMLNIEPLVVMATRTPSEVVSSLVNRDGMSAELAELLWLRGVIDAEIDTRNCQRCWLNFDSLLENWEAAAAKMSRDLGLIWPNPPAQIAEEVKRFVKPRFRHRPDFTDHVSLSSVTCRAWDAIEDAAQGQEKRAQLAFEELRAFLRDLDRLNTSVAAIAAQEARARLQNSLAWRLVRPIYALEKMLRGRGNQIIT